MTPKGIRPIAKQKSVAKATALGARVPRAELFNVRTREQFS